LASVPGSHRGPDSDKWGHRRLGHLLKKNAIIPSLVSPSVSNESWPVIAQCSSIGTLGTGPDTWMCGELRTSMSQRALLPGDMPHPPPKFKVVSNFEDRNLLGCDILSVGESFSVLLRGCGVRKYSFVNRTIKNWNQLRTEALGTFPCKPNILRNGVR
jgi:hypothetical protein